MESKRSLARKYGVRDLDVSVVMDRLGIEPELVAHFHVITPEVEAKIAPDLKAIRAHRQKRKIVAKKTTVAK